MTRLLHTMQWDVRFQWRYGLYLVTAFTTVVNLILLGLLPRSVMDLALPFIIFVDLAMVGFYFIAAIVLFEKTEGTLLALVVSPLRFEEYLAAKLITLSAVAVVISLVVTIVNYGVGFNWPLLIMGTVLTSFIGLLVGFIAVAPYDSISTFFIPAQLYALPLNVPLIPFFGWLESPIFYLFPTMGSLLVLRGAFVPIEAWQVVYGVVYQLVWIGLLYWVARWRFERYVVDRQGGR
jgi:fluoroquinolone transport system permease protein